MRVALHLGWCKNVAMRTVLGKSIVNGENVPCRGYGEIFLKLTKLIYTSQSRGKSTSGQPAL